MSSYSKVKIMVFVTVSFGICMAASRTSSAVPVSPKKGLSLLWTQKMPGAVSSLSAAATGEVLVATNPDPDIVGSSSRYLLTRLTSQGKIAWQKVMADPVKEQDISSDGSRVVVSNYGDQVLVFDAKGKLLWSKQGTCKPYFLNQQKKILCYHDEDVDSKIAFDLYDLKGKKLLSYGISGDILGFKLALDQNYFGVGLTQGRVLLFSSGGLLTWQKKLPGEVVDVAVSSGQEPRVAVLLRELSPDEKKKGRIGGQILYVLNTKGEMIKKAHLPIQSLQIEMTPSGDRVFYHGGSGIQTDTHSISQFFGKGPMPKGKGQVLGAISLNESEASATDWVRGIPQSAVYFHPFVVGQSAIYFGIESSSENVPVHERSEDSTNHLLLVNYAGEAIESVSLTSDEGSFFYAHRVAGGLHPFVAVATDDGRINAFRQK